MGGTWCIRNSWQKGCAFRGSLFKAIVRRPRVSAEGSGAVAPEIAPETPDLHQKHRFSGANPRDFAPEIALEIAPELSALLDRIIANPRITTAELASALKVSRRTVLARITTLKEKGILRRIGPSKGGKWELIP